MCSGPTSSTNAIHVLTSVASYGAVATHQSCSTKVTMNVDRLSIAKSQEVNAKIHLRDL